MSKNKKKRDIKESELSQAELDCEKDNESIPFSDYDGGEVDDEREFETFASEDEPSDGKKEKKKRGMTKKHLIAIAVFAVLFVTLLLIYLLVLAPKMEEQEQESTAEEAEEPIPLIEGEVRSDNGINVLFYPYIDRANTESVTVVNPKLGENGGFTVIRATDEDSSFYVKEHGRLAPIKAETVLSVVAAAGNTVISQRIEENATNLSQYGLAPENNPASVTIETRAGDIFTYYIGNLIPAEGGYYCREDGRNAVYIIALDNISILTRSSENLLNPILGFQADGQSALTASCFELKKNGQRFVRIRYVENNTTDVIKSSYEMEWPMAKYTVNDDNYGTNVLTNLGTLMGYMVVCAGDGTSEGALYKNTKLMSEYGFYDVDNPPFEVYYEFGDNASHIMFTHSGNDAYYYAYSLIYDMIVLVEKTSVPFLDWDLLEYVNDRLFYEYIDDVKSISVSGKVTYYQKDYEIDGKVTYIYDDDGNLTSPVEFGGSIKFDLSGENEVQNPALAFYQVALTMRIGGYISDVPSFNFNEIKEHEYARFTVEYTDGRKQTIVFYLFSGSCYYTIDGYGDFYVSAGAVNRLLVNMARVAYGYPVDVYAEYPLLPDEFIGKN